MNVRVGLAFGMLCAASAGTAGSLLRSIDHADAIIIAQATPGSQKPGGEFDLTINRVLKGSLAGPSITVTVMSDGRPLSAGKRRAAVWNLLLAQERRAHSGDTSGTVCVA